MQRNHWTVAPSTASPWERHSKHSLDLPPITSSTSPLPAKGTTAKGYDTHPFAGISHIVRTRNIFHNCNYTYLQGKAGCKNEERASILWKTVEKKGYEKKSTQHRWHLFRCNGFNSFNRKINYSFIGIYLLYYLLNRYYKCCRMLKMVLTGCCRVLKDVERVLNGVGMIKCAKWTCCSCWKRWTAFRGKWTISRRHEKCRPLSERHRSGEADVIHPRWWDHRPHRG